MLPSMCHHLVQFNYIFVQFSINGTYNSSSPCLRVLPLLLFLVCTVYCEWYIASLMNMRGLFVHLYLVRVRAVVVALEAVEMTAALLVCACITKHEQLMN